jgi:hypothetical protein
MVAEKNSKLDLRKKADINSNKIQCNKALYKFCATNRPERNTSVSLSTIRPEGYYITIEFPHLPDKLTVM